MKFKIDKAEIINEFQSLAAVADKKLVDQAVDELTLISGQKAVGTNARTSIAGFKISL